ncbi:MAG: cell envelope integrity protein TolA [Pseudomonadota bacterium]
MRENWLLTSRSFLISIAIHIVLGVVLVFSFNFSSKTTPPQPPKVNIVKAATVDKEQVELELKRLKDQEDKKIADELKRQKELEKKEADLKKKLQKEEKKLNEIKKKKELEQKKINEEKLRLKKLEEEKKELEKKKKLEQERKKKEAEKKKQEAERKKKEAEQKKLEEEKKKKAEEEAERKAREAALQEELEAELEAEQEQRDLSELQKYQLMIANSIEKKFNRLGLDEGLSCVILIRMIEGGKVVEASIVKSSGNDLFDKRAEDAVYKASPLPVPDESRLFEKMRNIRFTFEP